MKVSTPDFLAKFIAEADASLLKMLDEKVLISCEELAERLHISKTAVLKAVCSKRIFAISGPSDKLFYPAFYADSRYNRRALEKVSKVLGDIPAGSKLRFFTQPKFSLGSRTPLDVLANGDVDAVVLAAAGYAER